MGKKLTLDPDAKLEIRDAAIYDEEAQPGLGEEFIRGSRVGGSQPLQQPSPMAAHQEALPP